MQDNMFRKCLVLGIIVLFVGASVVPGISGNIKSRDAENTNDFVNEKLQSANYLRVFPASNEDISIKSNSHFVRPSLENVASMDDQLDQYNHEYDDEDVGWAILYENDNDFQWIAQSFVPTMPILTRVKLWLFEWKNMTCDIIVSIRSDINNGSDLVSISKGPDEIPDWPDGDWVEFDFLDISVNIDQKYYILCNCWCGDSTENGYAWVFGYNTSYTKGELWVKNWGTQGKWVKIPPHITDSDCCFETYGTDGDTLYVGGSGGGNYSTIQSAIDDASDGDTVFVYDDSSPYYENIVINKSINLIGEGRDTTIIDGGEEDPTIIISADWVSINGFTIYHSFRTRLDLRACGIIVLGRHYNSTISNNIITNNECGIICSSNSDIFENTITNNFVAGIYMGSSNNNIFNNTIVDNYGGGILLSGSSSNNIVGNKISTNSFGIYLETSWTPQGVIYSDDNHLYHNNFIDNAVNAVDECNNIWDDGFPSGGNYWDDYTGSDNNGDGIGDTSYPIPGGDNEDRYPLMEPWGGGNQPSLKLFIEDAPVDHGVIWKAPGDLIDVVMQINNPSEESIQPVVAVGFLDETLPENAVKGCFLRNDFSDINEQNVSDNCFQDGNNIFYIFTSPIDPGHHKQIVFRIKLPDNAPANNNLNRRIVGEVTPGGDYLEDEDYYRVTQSSEGIIVTNRHVLFSKFGDDTFYYGGGSSADVEDLLNYLYDISALDGYGKKKCIVYYVDHYDDLDVPDVDLTHWDNHNDIDWDHPNEVHNAIDYLIEEYFVSKTNPEYSMIVGGDEIVPFYRKLDETIWPSNEQSHPYPDANGDPVLESANHNCYLSDAYYADTDHRNVDKGKVELSVGRIVGASALDMKKFIERGIAGPEITSNAIVTNFPNNIAGFGGIRSDMARNHLRSKWEIYHENTLNDRDWTLSELNSALNSPFTILTMFNHGEYYNIECPGGGGSFNNNAFPYVDVNKPTFFAVACRIIPTDVNGQYWDPSWIDNMIYVAVNHGISGGFFSGGIAYYNSFPIGDVAFGEKLGNQFFGKLITTGQKTNPVGKAFKNTKQSYDTALWIPKDFKTVKEFNYYGVPWMKIPQGSRYLNSNNMKGDSEIIFTVSDPIPLENGSYSRNVQVNVTGYHISSFGGFDLIIINGTKQSYASLKPVVPYSSYSLLLPKDANVSSVELIDNISSYIGTYNLPCTNESADENGGVGASSITDVVGYYPEQIFGVDITNFSDYQQLKIIITPVKHNPNTNDTILYTHMKFNVTYHILNPIVLHEFNIDDFFVMGDPIEGFVTLENVGSENLSNLRVNLSVENMVTGNSLFNVSYPFELDGGESKEVSAVIDELVSYGGSYLAKAEIIDTNNTVLASSTRDIFVSSGEIVEFNCPESVDPGDLVNFSILFQNNNVSSASATGVIRIYDSLYRLVDELTSSPIDIPSGSSGYINITWNTFGMDEDRYTVSAMVNTDNETYRTSNKRLIIDGTLPEIADVSCFPSTQLIGGFVNISCNVSDNVGLNNVKVNVSGPAGFTSTNTSMIKVSNDTYYYNVSYSTVGNYSFFIYAKDISGNENTSTVYNFIIYEVTPPVIVDNTPSTGYTSDAFTFNATVTDNIEVSTVCVEYWYGTGSHTNESMIPTGVDDYYEKAITIDDTLDTLYYIIAANDTSDNWNDTGVKDVTIYDNDNPIISGVQAVPLLQNICESVNISASAVDNIEVDEVYLYIGYPDTSFENFSISQNKTGDVFYCNRTYPDPGIYTFHIWANDTSGNAVISADFTFEIVNSPPYTPGDPDPYDGETDVDVDYVLCWTGGDPDFCDIVTYDVYFGTSIPLPLVSSNQSGTCYDPGVLDYNTTYYWQIVAWDNHGASAEGPIWEFTTEEAEPDLECDGSLSWTDVEPGSTVTGSFTVSNVGEAGSLLDWEVESYPTWGTWTFNPESGTGLEEGDTVTIDFEIVAPDEPETEFTGEVKIVNSEDPSDYCIIPVSLITPVSQNEVNSQLLQFFQRFIERFPLLERILELHPHFNRI